MSDDTETLQNLIPKKNLSTFIDRLKNLVIACEINTALVPSIITNMY